MNVNNKPIVAMNHVDCKMGYRYLLKDINWEVYKGEHWVIYGANGSGKTTLLSIIAGFQHHTSGTVKLYDEIISEKNILDIRKRIGWVSSSFFDKHYTKESILDIVLSGKYGMLGLSYDITLDDVLFAKRLLTELGLGDMINRGFDMLSKGQRQNVLIARALISKPDILILDEPCTGLDVYYRKYLFRTIETLAEKTDITILYITHYIEEVLPLFKNALLLRNGRIFKRGAMQNLFNDKVFSELLGYDVKMINGEKQYQMEMNVESSLTDYFIEGEINGVGKK